MKTTTYRSAVKWLHNNYILCNDIAEVDPSVIENFDWGWDEDGNCREIYQWFISDCDDDDVTFLQEHFPSLLFAYSELLGKYILAVDHLGTSWGYVPCPTDLDNAPSYPEE